MQLDSGGWSKIPMDVNALFSENWQETNALLRLTKVKKRGWFWYDLVCFGTDQGLFS